MELYHCICTTICQPPPLHAVYQTATSDQTRLLPLRGNLEADEKSDTNDPNPLLRLVSIAATIRIRSYKILFLHVWTSELFPSRINPCKSDPLFGFNSSDLGAC